jgi:ketosteroid isomerase-like protein
MNPGRERDRVDSASKVIAPDGRLAYLLSSNAIRLPGEDGRLVVAQGRAVTVWRRETDGEWRCVIDIWNDGNPATGAVG